MGAGHALHGQMLFEEAELLHLLDQRAAAHLLQRHDIGIDLAQHMQDPLRAGDPVATHAGVNIVASDAKRLRHSEEGGFARVVGNGAAIALPAALDLVARKDDQPKQKRYQIIDHPEHK